MGAGRGGEDDRTDHADQHRHQECAPPATQELGPGEHEDGGHVATMTFAGCGNKVEEAPSEGVSAPLQLRPSMPYGRAVLGCLGGDR